MPAANPRRFIAGAVCSQCKTIDTTVMFSREGIYHIECIHCGFTQSQDDLAKPVESTDKGTVQKIQWKKRGQPNSDQGA